MKQPKFVLACLFMFVLHANAEDVKVKIKDGVYKDGSGHIYFKVPNPDQFKGPDKSEFIYLEKVYVDPDFVPYKGLADHDYVPLKDIVDLESVSLKNKMGTYFVDKNYVYIFIFGFIPPGHRQFFVTKNENAKVFGRSNGYLKSRNEYYYDGVPVFDLDVKTAEYLVWKAPGLDEQIELLKDKNGYYYVHLKLTTESVCRMGFSDALTSKVIQDLLGKKSGSAKDCH